MKFDTLGARLFLLMWLALVVSHIAAYSVAGWFEFGGGPPPGLKAGDPPGPRPGTPDAPGRPPGATDQRGPPPRPSGDGGGPGPQMQSPLPTFPSLPPTPGLPGGGSTPPAGGPPQALPTAILLLDYGVRLIVIAGAAWFGSRWLARPMKRLVQASAALVPALAKGGVPPRLPETEGTREVKDAALVFNGMATQIAQQFESRGLMIAAISHDLRTPLTRIRMRLETSTAEPELRERCVADIREMNALIDSVLEVFRRDTGEGDRARRVDIAALLQALVDDHAELGAEVEFEGASTVARVDPVALKRLVGNLVDNALRYAGRAEVSVRALAHECRIVVQDRGPGIPAELLEAVQKPFVRVESSRHRATGGTGLGLFIARELAERHGGRLVLANREGGGLRAEVVLPL